MTKYKVKKRGQIDVYEVEEESSAFGLIVAVCVVFGLILLAGGCT